jgi:hypothetical protein
VTAITASFHRMSSGAQRFGIVAMLTQMVHDLVSPYHPERHYMRGPGPAWCRKHGIAYPLRAGQR